MNRALFLIRLPFARCATCLALVALAPHAAACQADDPSVEALLRVHALTPLVDAPEAGDEIRVLSSGGHGMLNSFLRAPTSGTDAEFRIWWTTVREPGTPESEAAPLEEAVGEELWTDSCRYARSGRPSYTLVNGGDSTPIHLWVTSCSAEDLVSASSLSRAVTALRALDLASLGSNEIEWADESGVLYRQRDGTGLRGSLVQDGSHHAFRWFSPATRREAGAETAAQVEAILSRLTQEVIDALPRTPGS